MGSTTGRFASSPSCLMGFANGSFWYWLFLLPALYYRSFLLSRPCYQSFLLLRLCYRPSFPALLPKFFPSPKKEWWLWKGREMKGGTFLLHGPAAGPCCQLALTARLFWLSAHYYRPYLLSGPCTRSFLLHGLAVGFFCYLGCAADTFYSMNLVTGSCHLGLATGLPAIQAVLLGSFYNLGLLLASPFRPCYKFLQLPWPCYRSSSTDWKARILHNEITVLQCQIPFTSRIYRDRDISGISLSWIRVFPQKL